MKEITQEELVDRAYRYIQCKNSQLEDKYKKLLRRSRSWCSKYQHIVQKTKQELKEQFTDEALGEAIKETKRELECKYRHLEFELKEEYHKMQEDYKDNIIDSLKKNYKKNLIVGVKKIIQITKEVLAI